MIDPLDDGLRAVAAGSVLAYPLVFAAGALSGIGPCVAPRYVAIAALAHAARRPWRAIAMFLAGLIAAYVVLGVAAGAVGALRTQSTLVFAALAVVLIASGVTMLWRDPVRCAHAHAHAHPGDAPSSAGGAILAGAASVLVVAPCCTPVVAAIAGFTTLSGRLADGALLLATFALGHTVPLVVAASCGTRLASLFARAGVAGASATVGGGLLFALGGYYAVLA